ncbi:hypothetical protein ALC57_18066 [Trachymyrmex cornetzi]|uniref:Uncharacterized protein n=1 Tax=Trachymyrmex cornetzi TaxID=471704 RepID=A0A151ISJ9_9HYME|nr:hypothetical protein ALC57_18066 [Trachymyrmex cornetzi]
MKYANVLSVTKPEDLNDITDSTAVHELKIQVVDHGQNDNYETDEADHEEYVPCASTSGERHLVTNADFRDLTSDLELPRRKSELLGSRLKNWNLVENDFKITLARNDHRMFFRKIFKADVENNLGQMSDEQGKRFYQEIRTIEERFQGKSSINMLADYCWSLIRETNDEVYSRKRSSKHF